MVGERYGSSASGRIATAAMLAAFGTLIRKHPKTALDMTGAGLKQAGQSAYGEIKHAILPGREEDGPSRDQDVPAGS